jgi:hypothetical protein
MRVYTCVRNVRYRALFPAIATESSGRSSGAQIQRLNFLNFLGKTAIPLCSLIAEMARARDKDTRAQACTCA